ncbi:hypothetical protein [Flavobacterium hydrophilum]|uniref:Uncharacterized protein n=1 Tax=Flavobacterium hydrophilum TaxID=2211445 RepID=A0A2V4C7X2_9FLAO|nr:hypothetical protein [Flavobacterium hydrophilum]PXY46040.1 hypothetical protein DMB68_02300 [Flavobacterium hydrophilum]
MRKITRILILSLFCVCNYACKKQQNNIKKDTDEKVNKENRDHHSLSRNDSDSSFFTYKKWDLVNKKEGEYKSSNELIQLKKELDEKNNIGGIKFYLNNKEVDFIISDAYVFTPYLFVDKDKCIILIKEEDEGGIYGYFLYYFDGNKPVTKEYLDIAPINDVEINKFIQFKNSNNSIKISLLTEKYYNTDLEKNENSNSYNFIVDFNKKGAFSNGVIAKNSFNKIQLSENQSTQWRGKYSCNFLRMKEESADPRAYAMIYINIEENAATFQLESYLEDLNKGLFILSCSSTEIILVEKNNKNSKFIITKNNKNFKLKSDLLDKTIGEISTYELVKK